MIRLGLAAAALGAATAAHAAPLTPGAGFDVTAYAVSLHPDLADRSLSGETEIRLKSTVAGLASLAFTDNALVLDEVRVDGRPAPVTRGEGVLAIALPRPLATGEGARVQVRYRGRPKRGVSFGEREMHTEYFACDWMICAQDKFGDKATMRLTLTVPAGLTSLGPGVLESRRRKGAEEVHVWREPRPYPAYLDAFAVGPYALAASRSGTVELQALSATATAEELQRLFAPTADMLAFFQAKAGVPFPHARYTQLLVPGGAAQEASGHSVIGRDGLDPGQPQEDWLIAHELAHQWWGNLVTCKNLDHFWLNEGITTFMVAAWKEHRWGRAAYDRELDLARQRVARAKSIGVDVPLTFDGPYPSLGARRAIQYSKGALFLDALRTEVGEAAFWDGIQRFTREHAGGVVDSRDFQRDVEAAAGRGLDAIFDAWVY